jgi:hypothetical protein
VLLVAPPPFAELDESSGEWEGALVKSRLLSRHFRLVAGERGCDLLDAAEVISSSKLDGIHLDLADQHKLGLAVAARVRRMLE